MPYTVYAIRCKENGKMYIGRTGETSLEKRYKKHRYRLNKGICYSKSLQKDWDKYGQSAFEITHVFETEDYEYAKRLEKLVTVTLGTNNEAFGYNKQDPAFNHYRTDKYERRKTEEAQEFLKRRILDAVSGDITDLSNRSGYSKKVIKEWQEDPLSIKAVDLIHIERIKDLLGTGKERYKGGR